MERGSVVDAQIELADVPPEFNLLQAMADIQSNIDRNWRQIWIIIEEARKRQSEQEQG